MYLDMLSITIIGMVTVFIALVGLSYVLDILKIGFAPEEVKQAARFKSKALVEAESKVETPEEESQNVEEIAAVLAAAVAVYLGKRSPEFKVTNIYRVPMTTPVWGHSSRTRRIPHSN